MARPRKIDRDRLLEAAERVIADKGLNGFSLGAVATAAEVPKASVQSAFRSKENLVHALIDGWIEEEQVRYQAERDRHVGPRASLHAHIRVTQAETAVTPERVAMLLMLLARPSSDAGSFQDWYRRRFGDLTAVEASERRGRLAMLATEGAFFLRFLGLAAIGPEVWNDIFDDIGALAWD